MPLVPIAAFLAGALLTLLLPVSLLIALVAWYWAFSMRVPETGDVPADDSPAAGVGAVPTSAAGAEAAVPDPGPSHPPGESAG